MSQEKIKIKLAQINFTLGDLDGNFTKILQSFDATKNEVDLVVFSELALIGYPPEDLLGKRYFIENCQEKIQQLAAKTTGTKSAMLVGAPNQDGSQLFNSLFLLADGKIAAISNKVSLPNYGVFDEKRYFDAAAKPICVNLKGFKLALLVCEDIWETKNAAILQENPDFIISSNASPFCLGKDSQRLEVVQNFSKKSVATFYLNQVGGQDSLVFDGASFVTDKNGKVTFRLAEFAQDEAIFECSKNEIRAISGENYAATSTENKLYQACTFGLRDYVEKSGFKKVLIGMSGGIDSALVAAIAADALGSENVNLVTMPSKFNSAKGINDAYEMAKNLEIDLGKVEIEKAFQAMISSLAEQFEGTKPNVTEENLQSRIRGNFLMAISNKFGYLLITTGNKSEMATGYATIYGDMCGAFNPLKDLYKTQVFVLSNWRNKNIPQISRCKKTDIIPQNIITKEPSAELRENQKDSDSLPSYDVLDAILFDLIEEEKPIAEIGKKFDAEIVKKVARLFYMNEYKRRQAVIGPKVSKMSFDKDRRYPIVNKFCD